MALPDRFAGGLLSLRRLAGFGIVLTGVTAGGCQAPTGTIDDEVYVEAMSRLSVAHARYLDEARSDSARAVALEELGVTPLDLREFAETHGHDTEKMFLLFEAIRVRADSLEASESRITQPSAGTTSDSGTAR